MQIVFSADEIREAIFRLAEQLNYDYKGKNIVFLGVLKGSFLFLADLVRHITVPCSVDFVRLSSYGGGTRSSGTVHQLMARCDDVRDRHVIVVEEIVDSGTTLARLLETLKAENPASLKVAALVDKTGRREIEVPVDYKGFSVEDGFLIGYGLDLDEKYRNLPDIWVLEEHEIPT